MFAHRVFEPASTSPSKYKRARMSASAWVVDLITFEKYKSKEEVKEHEIVFDKAAQHWVYKRESGPQPPVEKGNYTLVMSPEGNIYIFPMRGNVHSSILWGEDVGAAGSMHFNAAGKMGMWAPGTGHYYTGFENDSVNTGQLLQEIGERGDDKDSIKVRTHNNFPR